jgi:hypothetical protein
MLELFLIHPNLDDLIKDENRAERQTESQDA